MSPVLIIKQLARLIQTWGTFGFFCLFPPSMPPPVLNPQNTSASEGILLLAHLGKSPLAKLLCM